MKKPGHRSSESNVVPFISARNYIEPPSDLAPEELRIFKEVVERFAPAHFTESDKPLVTLYCTAVHLSRLYAEHGYNDVAQRMRLETENLVALLAGRLRLSS